ncbi:MAG: Asp-tRNA(Asn)/Glu-tRNA(Gln) amidotransferase subunit GatB [Candidatus Competibacteraceae bacterium]|nr:Asp-tRNA(Asn)/Glu-tRNA(Gln) amidotransferase subunit GatB [Candidatus Competibacteraceae bacterium]
MTDIEFDNYEVVVGLEVHAQLLTLSKAYSSDAASYGASPNTLVSPVSLGLPGTLPVFNQKVLEFAVKLGIALQCDIRHENRFARKNYFYADLPKGYQITQDDTPICYNGFVTIKDEEGREKKINLERIHMEEDAGKSMHDQDPFDSLIDLNRAGVPLIEIVSKPELRSAKEAYNYLTEIRKIVRYLDICDGNMEEGSLRCDANISVRKKGDTSLGKKVEVKNMNSIRNVQRAIEFETKRQIQEIKNGQVIHQETRSFDALNGSTIPMRSKEMAHDYRYFTEPDLPPVFVNTDYIAKVKSSMPPLPSQLFLKYTQHLGLSDYDAAVITESKQDAMFFEQMLIHTQNVKAAANWMMVHIKSYLNELGISILDFPLQPKQIAEIIHAIDHGMISQTAGTQSIFPALINNPTSDVKQLAAQLDLLQQSDEDALSLLIDQVLSALPDDVARYRDGKKGLLGMFMGEVMKASKGKADPKITNQLLRNKLDLKP